MSKERRTAQIYPYYLNSLSRLGVIEGGATGMAKLREAFKIPDDTRANHYDAAIEIKLLHRRCEELGIPVSHDPKDTAARIAVKHISNAARIYGLEGSEGMEGSQRELVVELVCKFSDWKQQQGHTTQNEEWRRGVADILMMNPYTTTREEILEELRYWGLKNDSNGASSYRRKRTNP